MNRNDFERFASLDRGISPMTLHRYGSATDAYINPSINEERKLNVASMDVFSRLMMDRIIFLGVPIDDDVANIIQAQLLYLSSVDDQSDISLYINTPGGVVHSGLGIYATMQLISPDVATICTGMAASMGSVLLAAGAPGKRSALPHSRVMIHQPLAEPADRHLISSLQPKRFARHATSSALSSQSTVASRSRRCSQMQTETSG